ncbi:MAG: DMT family transporter, partial [Acidimicrobiia bacterium]
MSAVIVRGVSADAPATVFFRLWLSVPVWYVVMLLSGARLSVRIVRDAFGPAVLFAGSMAASFEAFKRTSIANASLIPSLQPALILLLASQLMGERRSNRELALAGLAFAGVVGVVLGGAKTSGASRLGDLLAFVNLLLFAAYFLKVKRIRTTEVPVLAFLTAMFLLSAVLVSPWALLSTKGLDRMHGPDWLLIFALIVGPGLMGHGLMTWAQKFLDVTTTSLLNLGAPVV